MHPPADHFEGKSPIEHLKEARLRGAKASAEIHGAETPGHLSALADAARETSFALLILGGLAIDFVPKEHQLLLLFLFSCGWILWKTGRSALLGWARMDRLHRVIEEERWEIEHHRTQEKEELIEMYRTKGFSGRLLDEVVEVLMADDNRLLKVMLEEELGLTLEMYEHPLKQSAGALCGALLGAILCIVGFWITPSYGLSLCSGMIIIASTYLTAKIERTPVWNPIIWSLGLAGLVWATLYFLIPLFNLETAVR